MLKKNLNVGYHYGLTHNNTESRKKHLNFAERITIEFRLKNEFSQYKISKKGRQ
ncbi:hypothetical protein CNEO2_950074 [Clostridium neonatale]|nr:hypothetical protein CNEO2_950074 [Clostridium neonatale]